MEAIGGKESLIFFKEKIAAVGVMWSSSNTNSSSTALIGLQLFFLLLLTSLTLSNKSTGLKLFTYHHGRIHRLSGLFHLCWLVYGASFIKNNHHHNWHTTCLQYDILLGLSGIITTLTASYSFPHKHVINRPGESGTLSQSAIVTQSEMVEHSFYQGVNLIQAVYLHFVTWTWGVAVDNYDGDERFRIVIQEFAKRFGMLLLVTLPWVVRKRFPVNSFSANWKSNVEMNNNNNNNQHNDKVENNTNGGIRVGTQLGSNYLWLINGMYRFKKWQYVFYKHVILHGLNISIAASHHPTNHNNTPLPLTPQWRTFWLLLNTSYVMEFFLQSLVKRRVLTQRYMMILNFLLMISASIASMESNVLGQVKVEAALISLCLNFWNRGHDVGNTMMTFIIVYFGNQQFVRRII
mmetsp:Transcript_22309/g.36686  ORF Transcript_22309/g.36686 Transcript_22309/m.36686 type:complete len:406 (+) Transcript_22309:107-1324(+)